MWDFEVGESDEAPGKENADAGVTGDTLAPTFYFQGRKKSQCF